MSHRSRFTAVAACGALLLALAGCAGDAWASPAPEATAVGTPAAGFLPSDTPSPEATVRPVAGSWDGVEPPVGYRVVLLSAGDERTTETLIDAVSAWADEESVSVRTVEAGEDPVPAIASAMAMEPNLIISVGDGLIDALAMVTPNHLDQHFLVLGAELAEPTYNVTAVDWTGAGFRGEGLGTATHFDEGSFTPERGEDAVRAGVAAVLTGMTGVVLWID